MKDLLTVEGRLDNGQNTYLYIVDILILGWWSGAVEEHSSATRHLLMPANPNDGDTIGDVLKFVVLSIYLFLYFSLNQHGIKADV